MILFYVDTDLGCAIHAANSLDEARNNALREVGTYNYKSVRYAKESDVSWARSMGGKVPDGKIVKEPAIQTAA